VPEGAGPRCQGRPANCTTAWLSPHLAFWEQAATCVAVRRRFLQWFSLKCLAALPRLLRSLVQVLRNGATLNPPELIDMAAQGRSAMAFECDARPLLPLTLRVPGTGARLFANSHQTLSRACTHVLTHTQVSRRSRVGSGHLGASHCRAALEKARSIGREHAFTLRPL